MLVKQIPAWFVETNAWVVADEPGGKAILIDAPPDPDPMTFESVVAKAK